ncbi:hypothetical protein D3C87_2056590 [compost metagenome]
MTRAVVPYELAGHGIGACLDQALGVRGGLGIEAHLADVVHEGVGGDHQSIARQAKAPGEVEVIVA